MDSYGDILIMALSAGLYKYEVRGLFFGQEVEVVQWYFVAGAALVTADASGLAEAYWQDLKTDWRAAHIANVDDLTLSVKVSELDPEGAYGEYAVPSGEQQGTRSASGFGSFLPKFTAAGMRLTVGTRVTRPGQKRFWGWGEGDSTNGVLEVGTLGLLEALSAHYDSALVMGEPVALVGLQPHILHFAAETHEFVDSQPVVGHVTAPVFTTQNTRKR